MKIIIKVLIVVLICIISLNIYTSINYGHNRLSLFHNNLKFFHNWGHGKSKNYNRRINGHSISEQYQNKK